MRGAIFVLAHNAPQTAGLHPDTLGSLQRSNRPPAWIKGVGVHEKRRGKEKKNRGRRKKKKGKGKEGGYWQERVTSPPQ